MQTIIIASQNPVKIRAVLQAFTRAFPGCLWQCQGITSPSMVSDQPMSNAETLLGAKNRVNAACARFPDADFWVGIEGGIEQVDDMMTSFAWVYIRSHQTCGQARSGTFILPQEVARLVKEGKELGEADDIVFGRSNSKQDNGAVGLLTGDVVTRTSLYEHAVLLALIPFLNPEFQFSQN